MTLGVEPAALAAAIKDWGRVLGFAQIGIAPATALDTAASHLAAWLAAGWHGDMAYMARHGSKRAHPTALVPETQCVICVRMDYLPATRPATGADPADRAQAFVARYALGRDYHKVLRRRLKTLVQRIAARIGPFAHRIFVDSAPVMEKALAARAGLGWIGKHTNLISPRAGSWFVLGELYAALPLPPDRPHANHCGRCRACLHRCPTGALRAPYRLDARRCLAYLTVEAPGSIPLALRPALGNRIFGCDDCQLACPWNRFARPSAEPDFQPRHGLDTATLRALWAWDEATFLQRTAGSALRRLGYERWRRNLAVALGNAAPDPAAKQALWAGRADPSPLVREHLEWALARHDQAGAGAPT